MILGSARAWCGMLSHSCRDITAARRGKNSESHLASGSLSPPKLHMNKYLDDATMKKITKTFHGGTVQPLSLTDLMRGVLRDSTTKAPHSVHNSSLVRYGSRSLGRQDI